MMQTNISVKAVPLLKETQFELDSEAVIRFLEKYKSKEFVYPSAIHRLLKIDIKIIYQLLEKYVDEGILEQCVEIYCPRCKRYTGQYFKYIQEIPEEIYCLNCDEEIDNPLKYAIVVYRVV